MIRILSVIGNAIVLLIRCLVYTVMFVLKGTLMIMKIILVLFIMVMRVFFVFLRVGNE